MQQTTNYGLKKYEPLTDYVEPAAMNENMDAIDTELKIGQTHREDATVHIGTAAKITPVDADSVALVDSADGSKAKRLSWANLKTALGSLFAPLVHKSRHASGGADALSPADIGAVPSTRTVNNKALSADISLSAGDVGAHTKAEVASAATKALFGQAVDALPDTVFAALSKALLLISGGVKDALGNSVTIPAGSLGLKIVSGYFTANQAASRLINIGFTPDFVILMDQTGRVGHQDTFKTGGIAVTGSPCKSGSTTIFDITTNGFIVYYGSPVFTNGYTGEPKHYIAGKYT